VQPPAGAPRSEVDVSLRLETGKRTLHKTVRVYGPRVWYEATFGPAPGPAASLVATPLVYELAFGGADETNPHDPLVEWRNPAGTGVARDRRSLLGRPAPRIDDPHAPAGSRGAAPAGFGPIPPHWEPRSGFAGTYDARWRRDRAPIAP